MRRREFISLVGGAVAWPVVARGQQAAVPVVGFLGGASPKTYAPFMAGYYKGLSELGFVDGRNVTIEYRWADGKYDRLPALATELVNRHVTVLAAPGSTPAALAAKAATATIPIVFFVAGDPIALGLVGHLNRPDRNMTGVTGLTAEVAPKRLELLHELMPTAKSFALLINQTSPAQAGPHKRDHLAAANRLGLQLHILQASNDREIETAFATLVQLGASGLVIAPDVFFNTRQKQLAILALQHAVPSVYQYREFPAAGGLMSYGTDLTEMFRLSGIYTGRILKGAKPADLPVQQATKVELIINLKTAKALGLTFPLSLLGRADEVIE